MLTFFYLIPDSRYSINTNSPKTTETINHAEYPIFNKYFQIEERH